MNRLRFFSLLGCLLAAPLLACAQTNKKLHTIGYLSAGAHGPATQPYLDQFRAGMRDLGRIEGQDYVIEGRWADGKPDRLAELAAELVRMKVDIILTGPSTAAAAAHVATRTIPIVVVATGNPVGLGLAQSLARPSGNVTGLASFGPETAVKSMQLLKETLPNLKRLAVLWNPANPLHPMVLKDVTESARQLQVTLLPYKVSNVDDFERAFQAAGAEKADAVWLFGDPLVLQHRVKVAELAQRAGLPSMAMTRAEVAAGTMMAYAPDTSRQIRQAASYVDKILKGTKPGDLPIEQPTKIDLVISLKTAKSLGVTIPQSVLLRADEVVE